MIAFMRKLHRWLGLLVGLQLLIWIASGAVMSVLDAHVVSGEVTDAREASRPPPSTDRPPLEPAQLLAAQRIVAPTELQLIERLGRRLWRVQSELGVTLHDAYDGARVALDADDVWQIASAGYGGSGSIVAVDRLTTHTIEARDHELPLWRVQFDDEYATRFYIDPREAAIVERRTDAWEWFDVFWMLHTMDYSGRDDFNTPWVVLAAFAALWLALSGGVLLVQRLARAEGRGK